MARFVSWLQAFALSIGAPGLFFIAFLDSSFVSLPEINDLLVVLMVIENPTLMPLYAIMATLGSVVGCLVLYFIGRRGGRRLMERRFGGVRLERALDLSRRYGILAVAVPAVLPPPAPFKIFVLLAGVAHVPLAQFVSAIGLARGVRYFGEGWLAVQYGEQAIEFLEQNSRSVSIGIGSMVVLIVVTYLIWSRIRRFREDV